MVKNRLPVVFCETVMYRQQTPAVAYVAMYIILCFFSDNLEINFHFIYIIMSLSSRVTLL